MNNNCPMKQTNNDKDCGCGNQSKKLWGTIKVSPIFVNGEIY